MRYFDHDTTAASDDGIMALRLEHGGAAVDAYWCIIEKMYADEEPVNLAETNAETKSVLHRLGIGFETLKTYVSTMLQIGLLEGDVENLSSERVIRNIEAYHRKAETARQNGKNGGRKPTREPKGNQRGNQVGSSVGTDAETESVTRKEKKRKGIGSDKQNLIPGVGGAVAGEPAPPPLCPACDAPMSGTATYTSNKRERLYRCPLCGEEVFA